MSDLESAILQYEKDFFNAVFCGNIDNLENRLCEGFLEYGKSGRIHKREDVIKLLSAMEGDRDIDVYNFSIADISEDVLVAHYLSHEKDTNQYALRTSVWKKEYELWKLFFHQGTPYREGLE